MTRRTQTHEKAYVPIGGQNFDSHWQNEIDAHSGFEVVGIDDSKFISRTDNGIIHQEPAQPSTKLSPEALAYFENLDTLPTPIAVVEQATKEVSVEAVSEVKARARHRKVGGGLIALVRGR